MLLQKGVVVVVAGAAVGVSEKQIVGAKRSGAESNNSISASRKRKIFPTRIMIVMMMVVVIKDRSTGGLSKGTLAAPATYSPSVESFS